MQCYVLIVDGVGTAPAVARRRINSRQPGMLLRDDDAARRAAAAPSAAAREAERAARLRFFEPGRRADAARRPRLPPLRHRRPPRPRRRPRSRR